MEFRSLKKKKEEEEEEEEEDEEMVQQKRGGKFKRVGSSKRCECTTGFTTMQVKCIAHSILFFIQRDERWAKPSTCVVNYI